MPGKRRDSRRLGPLSAYVADEKPPSIPFMQLEDVIEVTTQLGSIPRGPKYTAASNPRKLGIRSGVKALCNSRAIRA